MQPELLNRIYKTDLYENDKNFKIEGILIKLKEFLYTTIYYLS